MSTNHTPNYALSQWERTDKIQMDDFNADNAKIDAALKAEADARTALAGQVSKRGNCSVEVKSYTGNGQYGPGTSTAIYFSKRPAVFFVIASQTFAVIHSGAPKGQVFCNTGTMSNISVSWSGASAYLTTGNGSAQWQLNTSGETYWVVAFYSVN